MPHAGGIFATEPTLVATAAQPGFSVLDQTLTDTLTALNLSGGTAVQIGCNNARELLSLAAHGITPALGIDQSKAFLDQAAILSAATGQATRLVEADIYDLPPDLGTHDLALVTIGVLNWMPDMPGFFAAVATLLAPGGRLVVYETHPILEMSDPKGEDPFALVYSSFEDEPEEVPEMIVYDGSTDEPSGAVGYWFFHTLGEVVTASISAGLVIERLTEHPHSNREPEYDQYDGRDAQVPMSYTMVARKGAAASALPS